MLVRALILMAGFAFSGALGAAAQAPEPRILTYKEVRGEGLKAHVFEPGAPSAGPRPAILLFHGGGWNSGDATWVYPAAKRFANLGLVAIAIDYRLSDEKAVTPLEAMEDARDAVRWARGQAAALRIDPARIAVHGVSAGGQLAAATALIGRRAGAAPEALDRPNAMLLYSPAVAIAESGWARKLLLGRARPESISPDAFVAPGAPPTYISQGVDDTVTPFVPALLFARRMRAAGNVCELKPYSSLGHLLTRKLDEQEWQFDPDPAARTDAWRSEEAFLARLGYIPVQPRAPLAAEAVVRALTEAFNAGKPEAAGELLAPNAEGVELAQGQLRSVQTGAKTLLASALAEIKSHSGFRRELHALVINGAFVSVRERDTWTGPGGAAQRRTSLVVYQVEGGQVHRIWRYPAQD